MMVTGRSGLLAVARTGEEVHFAKTDGIVPFASGAEAFLYSGACPEKLRGPEHHFAWCDEIAKWRYPGGDLGQSAARAAARRGAQDAGDDDAAAMPLLRRLVRRRAC